MAPAIDEVLRQHLASGPPFCDLVTGEIWSEKKRRQGRMWFDEFTRLIEKGWITISGSSHGQPVYTITERGRAALNANRTRERG